MAGLINAVDAGDVEPGLTITVTVTGHGLKDIDTALAGIDSIVDSVIDVDVREAAAIAGLA